MAKEQASPICKGKHLFDGWKQTPSSLTQPHKVMQNLVADSSHVEEIVSPLELLCLVKASCNNIMEKQDAL